MQRDPRAFLWDVRESAVAIQDFNGGMDADAYPASELVQPGVERKFEIIGEALNPLTKLDTPLAARTGPCEGRLGIRAFRNELVL